MSRSYGGQDVFNSGGFNGGFTGGSVRPPSNDSFHVLSRLNRFRLPGQD
jgi:hypothetical protein